MTIPKDFPGKLFPLIPPLKWRSAKIRQTGKMTSFKAFFVYSLCISYSLFRCSCLHILCVKWLQSEILCFILLYFPLFYTVCFLLSLSLHRHHSLPVCLGLTFAFVMTRYYVICFFQHYIINPFLSVLTYLLNSEVTLMTELFVNIMHAFADHTSLDESQIHNKHCWLSKIRDTVHLIHRDWHSVCKSDPVMCDSLSSR